VQTVAPLRIRPPLQADGELWSLRGRFIPTPMPHPALGSPARSVALNVLVSLCGPPFL